MATNGVAGVEEFASRRRATEFLAFCVEFYANYVSEHHPVRSMILPEVAKLIAERFGISESEALDRFSKPATSQNPADEENGLC